MAPDAVPAVLGQDTERDGAMADEGKGWRKERGGLVVGDHVGRQKGKPKRGLRVSAVRKD